MADNSLTDKGDDVGPRHEGSSERDAEGFAKFDGYVRLPCTGVGCDVVAYLAVGTDPAVALCHGCIGKQAKEAKMAAKKGKKTTKARETLMSGKANGVAAGAVGGDYVEKDRFEEALPVKIEASEADARARTLASVVHDHDALLDRRREVMAQFREKIAFFKERMKELSESVQACTEIRPVACVERLNTRQNAVEVVRLDTGEVVRSRAATAEDRQEEIPGFDDEPEVDDMGGDGAGAE